METNRKTDHMCSNPTSHTIDDESKIGMLGASGN